MDVISRKSSTTRDAVELGRRISDCRTAAGMSQKQLAGDDLSASYISLIESGKRWPTLEVLQTVAARLGTTANALMSGGAPPRPGVEIELDLKWSRLALQAGEPRSAEKYARVVLEDPGCSETHRLDALALLAEATEHQGRLDEAIDILEPLVDELDADETRQLWLSAQIMLCRCYKDIGDLGHAIDLGEKALRRTGEILSDEEVLLVISLAGAYNERGDVKRAGKLLSTILARSEVRGSHRNRGAALWNASLVAESEGRFSDAVRLAEQALALFGESDAVRNLGRLRVALAHLLLADSASSAAAAREQLDQARGTLDLEGSAVDRASCVVELARCALAEDDVAAAMELTVEAREIVEDSPPGEIARVDLVRGHCLSLSGRVEEGLDLMRGAASTLEAHAPAPEVAHAWKEVSTIARTTGDDALVIEALERAVNVLGVRPT